MKTNNICLQKKKCLQKKNNFTNHAIMPHLLKLDIRSESLIPNKRFTKVLQSSFKSVHLYLKVTSIRGIHIKLLSVRIRKAIQCETALTTGACACFLLVVGPKWDATSLSLLKELPNQQHRDIMKQYSMKISSDSILTQTCAVSDSRCVEWKDGMIRFLSVCVCNPHPV